MRKVVIKEFLLDPDFLKRCLAYKRKIALISDSHIFPILGKKLALALNAESFVFPSGEENKTRETKAHLEDQMLQKKFGRDTLVIALGGGVTTDIAGFIASTYMRGVPLILVPTTLLAMCDAAIGGKNGVNTSFGKNLIGTFYRPDEIFIALETLQTLPQSEIKNGVVEMIKHGLISDREFFYFLSCHLDALLNLDRDLLTEAIVKSYQIKSSIVAEDEKEGGKRRLLNFGHTVGHAIEKAQKFRIDHGKAVAIGIKAESFLASQLKMLPQNECEEIFHLMNRLELHEEFSLQKVLEAMTFDKKGIQSRPRFVMLSKIGHALPFNGEYCTFADPEMVNLSLERCLQQ